MENTEKVPTLADLFPTMDKFLPLMQPRIDAIGVTAEAVVNRLVMNEPFEIRQLPLVTKCSWLCEYGEKHLVKMIAENYRIADMT